nr:MAG TPA: hypothetical protein [Caudoviricetes sp.]
MIDIFNKIRRFSNNMQFEEGKPFEIVLAGEEDKNSSYKKEKMEVGKSYRITVKKYMTDPATSTFDFHSKWNDDKPMPLIVMQGSIEKETRGMYYMKLNGKAEPTSVCMCCGKKLTNPVSRLYGVGPDCGDRIGLIRIETEQEAREKWEEISKYLAGISWEGWVIKSAIKEWKEI